MLTLAPAAKTELQKFEKPIFKALAQGTSTQGPPRASILYSFKSLPQAPTDTVQPKKTLSETDNGLLSRTGESNLTSSDIISQSIVLRQTFQTGKGTDQSSTESTSLHEPRTHIETVVKQSLTDSLPARTHSVTTRAESVVQQALKDPGDGFILVGESSTEKSSDKVKLPRLQLKDFNEESAIGRLKGSKFEGLYSKVKIDSSGNSFYGDPIESEFSKQLYPLMVTRDGVYVEPHPALTHTILGSYRGQEHEGTTRSIVEGCRVKQTPHIGKKPGEINLLNFSKEDIETISRQGFDFWAGANEPFIDRAEERGDPLAIVSPLHESVLTNRKGERTGFLREIHTVAGRNYVYHPDSGYLIRGSEVTDLTRNGHVLQKTGHGIYQVVKPSQKPIVEASKLPDSLVVVPAPLKESDKVGPGSIVPDVSIPLSSIAPFYQTVLG